VEEPTKIPTLLFPYEGHVIPQSEGRRKTEYAEKQCVEKNN